MRWFISCSIWKLNFYFYRRYYKWGKNGKYKVEEDVEVYVEVYVVEGFYLGCVRRIVKR